MSLDNEMEISLIRMSTKRILSIVFFVHNQLYSLFNYIAEEYCAIAQEY